MIQNMKVYITGQPVPYIVNENGGGYFWAQNHTEQISFTAEGRDGGLYFRPISHYVIATGRSYKAHRYLIKLIPRVRELAYQLAVNGALWDYVRNEPYIARK